MDTAKIELNDSFKHALDILENTTKHVFVTGRAGTGKSTLLTYFREHTKKKLVVLAPTGVAALNVGGQTIHSFFKFRPDISSTKIKRLKKGDKQAATYQKLDAIVIDEVSMVRADLLDYIDRFMRLNGKNKHLPFGGVQMIFFGDLYQLPPVVSTAERELFAELYETPYFFSAKVFGSTPTMGGVGGGATQVDMNLRDGSTFNLELIELTKIYRQSEQAFIDLLNAIRTNTITAEQLEYLNQRHDSNYIEDLGEFSICLTTTNALADEINAKKLAGINKPEIQLNGNISGKFDLKYLPTPQSLGIKPGAQVMMLNNDARGRWVNGSIGQVKKVREIDLLEGEVKTSKMVIEVQLSTGKTVDVEPFTWEMYTYFFNEDRGHIDSEVAGSFTQYPLKLAWAVTIHKSQGKTFDHVILDIGSGTFAHGQAYVALSRCTSLGGLVLKKPIQKHHIMMDWQIVQFMSRFGKNDAETIPILDTIATLESAIECGTMLLMKYQNGNGREVNYTISPNQVGDMQYMGRTYLGLEAYCHDRREMRNFRVDRIVELLPAADSLTL